MVKPIRSLDLKWDLFVSVTKQPIVAILYKFYIILFYNYLVYSCKLVLIVFTRIACDFYLRMVLNCVVIGLQPFYFFNICRVVVLDILYLLVLYLELSLGYIIYYDGFFS